MSGLFLSAASVERALRTPSLSARAYSNAFSASPGAGSPGGLAEIPPPAAAAECSPDRQVRVNRGDGDLELRRSDGKGKDDWEPHFGPALKVVPICLRMAATNLEPQTLSPESTGTMERRA